MYLAEDSELINRVEIGVLSEREKNYPNTAKQNYAEDAMSDIATEQGQRFPGFFR